MPHPAEPLPTFLAEPSRFLQQEVSITGKWLPATKGRLCGNLLNSKEMLKEWEDIHAGAKADPRCALDRDQPCGR